ASSNLARAMVMAGNYGPARGRRPWLAVARLLRQPAHLFPDDAFYQRRQVLIQPSLQQRRQGLAHQGVQGLRVAFGCDGTGRARWPPAGLGQRSHGRCRSLARQKAFFPRLSWRLGLAWPWWRCGLLRRRYGCRPGDKAQTRAFYPVGEVQDLRLRLLVGSGGRGLV